ncbi:MAG: hypothetical protein M3Y27_24205, partial [Acidobacteriota bacterium]|nr:hypothetical protein [Acidobacteriota bacterium]
MIPAVFVDLWFGLCPLTLFGTECKEMVKTWSGKALWFLAAMLALAGPASAEFAYVANLSSNDVSGYTINAATGALTPIAGSP